MTWLYFVHTGIYRVILRTAWYILRYTTLYLESGMSRLASPSCLGCPLVPCIACGILPLPSLLDGQAPKAGLAAPKLPQPRVDFVDIAAPSSVQSSSVGTAKWEACFLALAEHVRDSRSRVTSQKQWDKRDPAHHILGRSHIEAGCLSFGNLPFFGRITQVKKSWGRAYQQSSKGTSWRSSSMQYGNGGTTTMVSCTQQCSGLVYTTIYSNGIYQYIPGITEYIPLYTRYNLVYTSIYHNECGTGTGILPSGTGTGILPS